jgi:hypothetical protein
MRDLAMGIIRAAAAAAGLPEPQDRVMDVSASDSITIPRPRVEVAFLPDSFTRTGRRLHVDRRGETQAVKKELYEIRFDVTAHVLAEDAAWLADFEHGFVRALPRGVNDARGNWVRVRVAEATFKKDPTKRVGMQEIKVFSKMDTLFLLTLTGRVTGEEEQAMITDINIVAPKMAHRE